MAEENSYLQYGDGLVLHNGLPVKWVTEIGDTYDIILHFSQDWAGGYTGFAALQQNVNNDYKYAHSYKLLRNTGERGYFGKKNQLSRKYTTSAETHLKHGANSSAMKAADPLSPAETFWFGTGDNIPCTAVVFPYVQNPSADFYVGLNTTAISAIDFTNHGSANKCEVVQMYVPDMVEMRYSLNASNFSAIRNLYGPNVGNALNCFVTYDDEFAGGIKPTVFENIYLPKINNAASATFTNVSEVKNVNFNFANMGVTNGVVSGFTGNTLSATNSTVTDMSGTGITATNSTLNHLRLSTNDNNGTVNEVYNNVTATDVSGIYKQQYNSSLGSWSISSSNVSASNSEFNGLTASTFTDQGNNKITNLTLLGGQRGGSGYFGNSTTADGNFNIYGDAIFSGTKAGSNFHPTVGNNLSANGVTGFNNINVKKCYMLACTANDISANYYLIGGSTPALAVGQSLLHNITTTGEASLTKTTANDISTTVSGVVAYSSTINGTVVAPTVWARATKFNDITATAGNVGFFLNCTAHDIYCNGSVTGVGSAHSISARWISNTISAEYKTIIS